MLKKKTAMSLSTNTVIIALLALNLIVGLAGFAKEDGAIKLEKLRAGWAENFAAIMNFYASDTYKQQQAESIPALLEQMGWNNPTAQAPTAPAPTAPAANASIKDAIANIVGEAHIRGKQWTRYTLLEYSDLECPFCKRHFQAGTIKSLVAQYPDTINYAIRHFPLQIHANAQMAGEALECAAELKNTQAYYDLTAGIFNLWSINKDAVIAEAGKLGINAASFTTCLDSGKYTSKVQSQMSEGQSLFGIRGTPGNVIVDTETGRFVAIPWAFPLEKFVQELETLIASE
jgi:protein-disulfide isomerase